MVVLLCSVFFVSCVNNTVMNNSSTNTPKNTIPIETPQEPTDSSAAKISKIDMIYGKWEILDMVGEGYIWRFFYGRLYRRNCHYTEKLY